MSEAQVAEVDAYVEAFKQFEGYMPEWQAVSGRGRDWQTRWPILDANGGSSGFVCFECDAAFAKVGISVIYRRKPIWRLDKIRETERKENPLPVRKYAPHLPREFHGSHVHAWDDHRLWVQDQGLGELPFRRPLEEQLVSFEQAFDIVAKATNLTVSPSQRGIALPAQSGLFPYGQGGGR